MEGKGFKNAPGVTEFKRGMRFKAEAQWWTVGFVDRGIATCPPQHNEKVANFRNISASFPEANLPEYELDLDSIWEGRRYRLKRSTILQNCIVRMVNDEYVTYECDGQYFTSTRSEFLRNYEPLPLDPPAPEQAKPPDLCFTCDHTGTCTMGRVPGYATCNMYGPVRSTAPELAKEEWRPEPGKECLRLLDQKEPQEVFVVAATTEQSWITPLWRKNDSQYRGFVVYNWELRPLPPESPELLVKLGARLSVTKEGCERVGKVCGVNPEDKGFILYGVGKFHWDEPGQQIVELRPVES